jgi:hypothetical protein
MAEHDVHQVEAIHRAGPFAMVFERGHTRRRPARISGAPGQSTSEQAKVAPQAGHQRLF